MSEPLSVPESVSRIKLASFILFFLCLYGVRALDMATPTLTVLFSLFALTHLSIKRNKLGAIAFFIVLVLGIFSGFVIFINTALNDLPKIIEDLIPTLINFANQHNIALPFSDLESLKAIAVVSLREQIGYLGNFAKIATKEFVFLIIGLVVAISLFVNSKFDLGSDDYHIKRNLYSILGDELSSRFATFYRSFHTVMGAQLVISTINTVLTAMLIWILGLPYFGLTVVITFFCGLLPIVGNVISNTIIFAIAIKISLLDAIITLFFLIVIHKLEYFLNSKIIGGRIKNPMWLTLLGLIAGERLMGLPGMILAPVLLHYLKAEGSKIEVSAGG